MKTLEQINLDTRTRARNDSLWTVLDWGGLMAPLAAQQAVMDSLGQPGVESFMAIAEENWGIKESQRDRTYQVDQFAVDQDRQIADDKAATGRAKLAIQRVTDDYILVVKIYGSKVRSLLMGAKEFAAIVEREQLANDVLQVGLSIQKELLRRDKIQADIYMENIHQAQVEEEIVRAQLDVVKAETAVKREELKLKDIAAKIYYATIERAQAEVDIAKAYLTVDKTYLAVDREKLHVKEANARVFYEDVQQAQIDADLAKTQLEILKANLSVAKEELRIKEVNAKVYYETVQQAQEGVDLDKTQLDVTKTDLAVDKEELRLTKVQTDIVMEGFQQKQVEADIAKAQVEVAKANVRAIMADIGAGEADIKVITAQIEQYMAQADKAGLQADVANIFAEIMVKKLSAVKLGVGQAEIAAGFGYIQSKLDDALAHLTTEKVEQTLKTDSAKAAWTEESLTLLAESVSEELRRREIWDAREVFNYTKGQTEQNIEDETTLKALSVTAKEALSDQKLAVREGEDIKKTWAQALVNVAQKYVHKNRIQRTGRQEIVHSTLEETKTIKKG